MSRFVESGGSVNTRLFCSSTNLILKLKISKNVTLWASTLSCTTSITSSSTSVTSLLCTKSGNSLFNLLRPKCPLLANVKVNSLVRSSENSSKFLKYLFLKASKVCRRHYNKFLKESLDDHCATSAPRQNFNLNLTQYTISGKLLTSQLAWSKLGFGQCIDYCSIYLCCSLY